MNKVFIVGNLAADPISRDTTTGKQLSNITVATNDLRSTKNEVYFFPCVAFSSQATFINTYLHKGDTVAIDGRLTKRSYVSKDGKTVYVTEIIIDNIKGVGGRRNNNSSNTNTNNLQHNNDQMISVNESFNENINGHETKIMPQEKIKDKEDSTSVELDWINETEE